MNKKLYRDEYHKMLGGVCSGLAEYFEMDVTVVRLLFAFTAFIMGVGFVPYIILWIVLPKKGYVFNNYNNPTVDYTVPPQQPGSNTNTPPPPPPGSSFGNNPFGGNPYGGNPFSGNPYTGNPVGNMPQKQKSHAGIIVGLVLITIGAAILIDEYDFIDFRQIWPVILIVAGGALMISGEAKKFNSQKWQKKETTDNPSTGNPPATDSTTTTES